MSLLDMTVLLLSMMIYKLLSTWELRQAVNEIKEAIEKQASIE